MSVKSKSNSTFIDDSLDSFLEVLSGDQDLRGASSRACALSYLPDSYPSSRGVKAESAGGAFILKEFEGPTFISCFDKTIQLSSSETESKKTKFYQKCSSEPNVVTLSKFRVPTSLKPCFVKNVDFEKEDRKLVEPALKKPAADVKFRNRRRARRNRFTLLENEPDHEDFFKSRNLIPTSDDIRDMYEKIFPGRGIPYIFGCQGSSEDAHCATKCGSQTRNFGLFMEVRCVEGRPMPPLVRENVAKIQNESGVIDKLSALIAVSAVKTPEPSKTRLIIPVSYDLVGKIGVVQKSTEIQRDFKMETECKYDLEANQVVEDVLKFIDRQSDFKEIDYDPDSPRSETIDDANKTTSSVGSSESAETGSPEKSSPTKSRRRKKSKIIRELGKLMNVSITDETADVEENDSDLCREPSCVLGCVCSSINDKPTPQDHCGNVECMFECSCSFRFSYVAEGELSKHEKSWHQTIVRKKNNDVEFQSGIERSKRQKKAPLKYEDAITGRQIDQCFRIRKTRDPGGLEECAPKRRRRGRVDQKSSADDQNLSQEVKSEDEEVNTEEPSPPSKAKEMSNECSHGTGKAERGANMKRAISEFDRAISEKRQSAVGNESAVTLDFVYIWCCIHDKYDCYCSNWVVMAKTNALILKPTRLNRYSAQKCMEKVSLGARLTPDARHVILFDSVAQCSRSAGCLVNYRARNATETFNNLMKSKIESDVLSYSNGFIKSQPVATIVPEDIFPNYPYFSGPHDQVRGIGEVVKMTRPSAEDEIIDVIDAPEGEPLPSDDDLMIDRISTLSQDVNDEFEYHPKPHLKKKSTDFRPCFSLYKPSKTNKSSSRSRERSPIVSEDSNSDSDVEIVERQWDCVSLTSSSSDVDVDEDSDYEDRIEQTQVSQISLSSDGSVMVTKNTKETSPLTGGKRPSTLEEPVPFKKQKSDDLPEIVISNDEPIVIESDDEDVVIVEDDDVAECQATLVATSPNQTEEISIVESKEDVPPSPKGQAFPQPSEDSNESSNEPPTEENGYPNFGLFCMEHPELGYATIEATFADGSILVTDPETQSTKFLKDLTEADLYMKGIVRKFINPKIKYLGRSKWSKATRGVLMKYKLKKIAVKPVERNLSSQTKSKTPNAGARADTGVRLVVSRKLVPSNQPKYMSKDLVVMKQGVSHSCKPQLVIPQPRRTQSLNNQTSDAEAAQSSKTKPTDVIKKVFGTFKDMIEATSFIEKNFETKVIQAQAQPLFAITSAATSTAGPIVGIRPGQPVPAGAKLMSVQTESGWRTVLIRGPVPATMSHKVRPLIMNNVRMSTNSPGFIKVTMPSPNKLASSVPGPVLLHPGVTGPATTTVAPVKNDAAATIASSTATQEPTPLAFSVFTDSTGKATCSAIALPKATGPKAILPKGTIVPTVLPSLRVKKKLAPRRADVIVPRNEAFATVISPTPTPNTSSSSVPGISTPSEAKVLYNGVVVSKPDPTINPIKGFVCDKKSSPTKMTSLLPQKTKDLT